MKSVGRRLWSSAAVTIFNTNKQAAATMCSAAEAMKLLLGGALGVELVTALLEAKTGEQIEKERAGSVLSWVTGGMLDGSGSGGGGGGGGGGARAGCTSESARTAIMTTAYFALLCVTAAGTITHPLTPHTVNPPQLVDRFKKRRLS